MGWWQYWQWSPPGVPTYSAVPNCGDGFKGTFVMAGNDTTDSKKKAVIWTLNSIVGSDLTKVLRRHLHPALRQLGVHGHGRS